MVTMVTRCLGQFVILKIRRKGYLEEVRIGGSIGRGFQDSIKSPMATACFISLLLAQFDLCPTSYFLFSFTAKNVSDLVLTSQVDSLSLMLPPSTHTQYLHNWFSFVPFEVTFPFDPSPLITSISATIQVIDKKIEHNSFAVKYLGNADWLWISFSLRVKKLHNKQKRANIKTNITTILFCKT